MKRNIRMILMAIGLAAASCHPDAAVTVSSCCRKETTPATAAAADPLTVNASIYQLPGRWTDQENHSLLLDELKGKVQVVAMIFTHCSYACPRLVQEMRDIRDSLSAGDKERVGYVLVSFDTDRDDPAALKRYAGQQGLDGHWELLHGSAGQVRELSLLLNVKYQAAGNGNYNHSNAVFILDKEGAVRQTLEGLGSNAPLAIQVIHRLEKE